jgi:hypothetical protein
MKRAIAALLLALAVPAAAFAQTNVATPSEHRRGEEQTFLTFSEWFLVHSPAEFARFLGMQKAPSEFPWGTHIAQFWQGYRGVANETAAYPFNAGYHLMVFVIGTSTTVEYALRSAYESTVGRLTEATAGAASTDEDRLAAKVAQAYVDFIRVDPWYLFDFVTPLRELWTAKPATGANLLRKWERRFALTTEYAAKAGYAWLIKLGTQSIYDEAKPITAVVLDREPAPLPRELSELHRLNPQADAVLVTVPRYRAFMFYAQALADQGIGFREIAGNRGAILVSVLARRDAAAITPPQRLVFAQPLVTEPPWERRVVAVPVPQLAEQLRQWRAAGARLEHVYDY